MDVLGGAVVGAVVVPAMVVDVVLDEVVLVDDGASVLVGDDVVVVASTSSQPDTFKPLSFDTNWIEPLHGRCHEPAEPPGS